MFFGLFIGFAILDGEIRFAKKSRTIIGKQTFKGGITMSIFDFESYVKKCKESLDGMNREQEAIKLKVLDMFAPLTNQFEMETLIEVLREELTA